MFSSVVMVQYLRWQPTAALNRYPLPPQPGSLYTLCLGSEPKIRRKVSLVDLGDLSVAESNDVKTLLILTLLATSLAIHSQSATLTFEGFAPAGGVVNVNPGSPYVEQ